MDPEPLRPASGVEHQDAVAVRLHRFEHRLDKVQADAAANGEAATEFALEATRRIGALEAELRDLSAGAMGLRAGGDGEPRPGAVLADVRAYACSLVAPWHREVLEALEDSTLRIVAAEARCAAAEAVAAEASGSAGALKERLAALEALPHAAGGGAGAAAVAVAEALEAVRGAAAAEAAAAAAAAEQRIREDLSNISCLANEARGPTGTESLEALRDLVESLESVSARVAALEASPHHGAGPPYRGSPVSPAGSQLAISLLSERLDTLEAEVPAAHGRLGESLLALWSAVREISSELASCGVGGGGSFVLGGHPAGTSVASMASTLRSMPVSALRPETQGAASWATTGPRAEAARAPRGSTSAGPE